MMRVCVNSLALRIEVLKRRRQRAFTIAEMLVVIVIIGLLAALVLPNIRGHSESVAINAACRQLVDDLSFARQKAISQRSTVAVVFIPPSIQQFFRINGFGNYSSNDVAAIKRLQGGAYTTYALYQYRGAGEQPGGNLSHGYITEWKSLPDKTFLFPGEFSSSFFGAGNDPFPHPPARFPFPYSQSPNLDLLPYIAFDLEGRCIRVDRDESGNGELVRSINIYVSRGSILFTRNADGTVDSSSYSADEIPPGNGTNNVIQVDMVTGRAKRLELQLQ